MTPFIFRCHFSSSISPHPENDAGGGAGAVGGDGFVDLAERKFVGDKAVEGHFVGADEVDEAGDLDVGRNAAAVGAGEDFFEVEGECVDGGIVACTWDADEDGAAVGVGEVVGEFDDAGVSSCIDHNVGTGCSYDRADFFGESGAFGGGVEGVGEAPAGGHVELGVMEIDTDDRVGADHAGGLGDVEADAADAEDDDALADLESGIVVHDADGCGHRASEERCGAEVEVFGDDCQAILGDDGLVVEGGDPAGIHGAGAPPVFGWLALEAAGRAPVENDVIAGADSGDAFADALDDAGPLVSEEVGEKFIGALGGFDLVDLCAADAAVVQADVDLAEGKAIRHFEFGKFQRGVGFNKDGGAHGTFNWSVELARERFRRQQIREWRAWRETSPIFDPLVGVGFGVCARLRPEVEEICAGTSRVSGIGVVVCAAEGIDEVCRSSIHA